MTADPVAEQVKPVVAKPDPEVLEAEIVDQPYTGMSYKERALADRELLELIDSSLESVAREAIAILRTFRIRHRLSWNALRRFRTCSPSFAPSLMPPTRRNLG